MKRPDCRRLPLSASSKAENSSHEHRRFPLPADASAENNFGAALLSLRGARECALLGNGDKDGHGCCRGNRLRYNP